MDIPASEQSHIADGDDIAFSAKGCNLERTRRKLQRHISAVECWAKKWRNKIHSNKITASVVTKKENGVGKIVIDDNCITCSK